MAAGTVRLYPDSTGKIIDTNELTVSANTVERQNVSIADPTNAAGIGAVVVAGSDPGAVYGQLVTQRPRTKSKIRNLNATVVAVKASAGVLYAVQILNTTGAACYVQIFDKAAGSVVLNTDTPDLEYLVALGAQLLVPLGDGANFTTAISIASTTTEQGLTGSASGVMVFRHDGPCILANDAAAQIFGSTKEQLLTQNFQALRPWQESGWSGHQPRSVV